MPRKHKKLLSWLYACYEFLLSPAGVFLLSCWFSDGFFVGFYVVCIKTGITQNYIFFSNCTHRLKENFDLHLLLHEISMGLNMLPSVTLAKWHHYCFPVHPIAEHTLPLHGWRNGTSREPSPKTCGFSESLQLDLWCNLDVINLKPANAETPEQSWNFYIYLLAYSLRCVWFCTFSFEYSQARLTWHNLYWVFNSL